MMEGLKGLMRIILSIIEKTSYFMNARDLKLSREPYSNDSIVNRLISNESVKYSRTFTISSTSTLMTFEFCMSKLLAFLNK